MKSPAWVPMDHPEKLHQSRPCPILSTRAALLDQMQSCILPQTSSKSKSPTSKSLTSRAGVPPSTWAEGRGQGWSSRATVLVLEAGQGLAALQHSTN